MLTLDISFPSLKVMKKTLLTLPQDLLGDVQKVSGASTKSQGVVIAMKEYLRDKKLNRLLQRRGKGFGITLKALLDSREKG